MDEADGLPVCRAEISAECETNLEEEVLCQDVREGTHDIEVVLDLVEAGFHVIGMDHDVVIWVCNVKDIRMDEYVLPYCAKFALELTTMQNRCHGVDGYGVPMVSP